MSAPPCIVLRCDASSEMGMGHLVRCEALAAALLAERPCDVHFAIRGSEAAVQRAERGGIRAIQLPQEPARAAEALQSYTERWPVAAVVFDVRDPVPDWSLERLHSRAVVQALVDNEGPMRLAVDLVFSPPMPQVTRLSTQGLRGTHYTGWEWVPLQVDFAHAGQADPYPARQDGPLLVCMGGADPAGLTPTALRALERVEALPPVTVVVGELYRDDAELRALCSQSRHRIELQKAVVRMAPLMRRHAFALASFGVIAYEMAAVGLPALYLSLTPDHALCAAEFERQGIARHLGLARDTGEAQIARALSELHASPDARRAMAERGPALVDGLGARRIAAAILARVEKRDG